VSATEKNNQQPTSTPIIRIAAAIITNSNGQMLVVRKRNSHAFIQPGGKLNPGETSLDALKRELHEELRCKPIRTQFRGDFSAPALNEPDHIVQAAIYHVDIDGPPTPAAEIEQIAWIDPAHPGDCPLALLTRDFVLPLARLKSS
jgi:8-oxo-dGTP pyrophosphatase MutT (NUDIX family)